MNKKSLCWVFMLLALSWHSNSSAACPDPDTVTTIPQLVGVEVKVSVDFDQKTGIYIYIYSITSGNESTGCIWSFEVDIKKLYGGVNLPVTGLTNHPFADLDAPDESSPEMIPVTFPSLPEINDIVIWGAGLTVDGSASWGSTNYIYEIMPGETLTGLVMTSYGLPALRDFKVEPKYIAEKEDIISKGVSEDEYIADTWKYLNDFYESIAWKGKILGPTAPPTFLKPVEFIDYIIMQKHEAYSLGWITNQGVENSLDVKLDNAKEKIQAGDTKTAKNILNAFLNELEAQRDKAVNTDAYIILRYNTKYLIEQL